MHHHAVAGAFPGDLHGGHAHGAPATNGPQQREQQQSEQRGTRQHAPDAGPAGDGREHPGLGRFPGPYGRKQGEVLAANCSPTPGTDREGATAVVRSYCKNPLKKLRSGAALDLKLLPSSVNGEDGLQALMALMRGFVALGGFFMQPDVADPAVLKAAQEHPEDYQTLSVRVSGWNARFVTLNKEWQDMVIEQTERGT